jgi:hypothetical protein
MGSMVRSEAELFIDRVILPPLCRTLMIYLRGISYSLFELLPSLFSLLITNIKYTSIQPNTKSDSIRRIQIHIISPNFHTTPPTDQSHPTPPTDQSHPTPPTDQSHPTPPTDQSHPTPPTDQSHTAPPTDQSHTAPPTDQSHPVCFI